MCHEALEALLAFDVPLPPEALAALMDGIDGLLRK
jgi:hypothetical protein